MRKPAQRPPLIAHLIAWVLPSAVGSLLFLSAASALASPGAGPVSPMRAWLLGHPTVSRAIVWESDGQARAWPDWAEADKASLEAVYGELCAGHPSGLGEALPNQTKLRDSDFATTVLSKDDARRLYLATVANTLVLETKRRMPWSISGYTATELAPLVDSREFFSWRPEAGGYVLGV